MGGWGGSSLIGNDWLVSASPCHLHRLLQGVGGRKAEEEVWRGEEERENLYPLSLSFISGSSGACFPRVLHFQISYLGPRFKYHSFIFLHVICMQLIKPGSLDFSFFFCSFFFVFFFFVDAAEGSRLSVLPGAGALYCIVIFIPGDQNVVEERIFCLR